MNLHDMVYAGYAPPATYCRGGRWSGWMGGREWVGCCSSPKKGSAWRCHIASEMV
ncbi:hypothetical protein [Methanogenium cariaci]|uniref:hypothetical protein n=1 Tax=Methanogenium cariaci TaxID=2197 RepID=UPI001C482BC2|nr:hypothetical protein [Methanogenium cariaci]